MLSVSYADSVDNTQYNSLKNKQIINSSNNIETPQSDIIKYISTENNNLNRTENSSLNADEPLAAGDDEPNKISQSSIVEASLFLEDYILRNGKLPNYVVVSDWKFSIAEFIYLQAKTIKYKYEGKSNSISPIFWVKNPSKPNGDNINGVVSSKDYYDYASRVSNYILKESTVPNYVNTPLGKIQYQTIVYSFVKILSQNLPSYISINIKKSDELNGFLPKYSRTVKSKPINDKYNDEDLEDYLQASKNCQVDDSKIQTLAAKITKNAKTVREKAETIYYYVRDNIKYSFYYNTKNGAKKTIVKKYGNCVDQSHLLVALYRASNIPARYIHGSCKFISGHTYGHVWAQVLVGKTWIAVDASHENLNKFGVIGNWDTSSYTLKGKYISLPF